jgi:serine/threonine protein phosphatase 1
MRSYAIGDIHGHLDQLKRVHGLIAADKAQHGEAEAPVVHIGDLVDRGPESRGVIDYLMRGIEAGENWVVLKGNHDRMFAMFMENPDRQDPVLNPEFSWLHPRLGGAVTLGSYGVDNAADRPIAKVYADATALVPAAHRDFLNDLPTSYRRGEVFFAHAGIRPDVPLDQQREDDLVWIREPFLGHRFSHGPLIVHGHTALQAANHYGHRLNIDSGAGYGRPLSAVVIEGREASLLLEKGRLPLPIVPDAPIR